MESEGERLLRRRAWQFRHHAARRVRGERSALGFVNGVGFCSTFFVFAEGVPCLWEAVAGRARPPWPRHSHHDAAIALTWTLKDVLPARRLVYYGKLLKGRPVLVALDLLPAFYALARGRQRARDYGQEYAAGRLSNTAKRLMDALIREHPQYTRELRANCFLLDPAHTREFERAMAELQQGLWVLKTGERYEPTFSYRWDLLETWLPAAVAEGRRLSRPEALARLFTRYSAAAVFTSERCLSRLFGLSGAETHATVDRLVRRGRLLGPRAVEGLPGAWLVHVSSPAGGAGAPWCWRRTDPRVESS
jgi:hypothetical protein